MKHIIIFFFTISLVSFELQGQQWQWTQEGNPAGYQVNGVAISGSGTHVLSATNCHPAKIRMFDVVDGSLVWDYTVPNNLMCMMAAGFSSDGSRLATVEEMGNVLIFDYSQNPPVLVKTVDMGTTYAFALDFAPLRPFFVVGGSNGRLQTYTLDGEIEVNKANAHTNWVTTVAYSPDNSKIVSGGSDDLVKVWDTTGILLNTFSGHTADISSAKFSPSGTRLASASKDKTIKIWDLQTASLLQTVAVSNQAVNAIAFSDDGKYLVSASSDSTLRIWDMDTYALVASFGLKSEGYYSAVTWKGDLIVAGTEEGMGKVIAYKVDGLLGLNTANVPQVKIFPNPASSSCTLRFPSAQIESLQLIDLAGRVLRHEQGLWGTTTFSLQTETLPAGNYVIQLVKDNAQVLLSKLIIE